MTSADVISLLLPRGLSLRKEGTSNEVKVRQIALPHSNNLPNPLVMFPSLASVSYISREGPLSSRTVVSVADERERVVANSRTLNV